MMKTNIVIFVSGNGTNCENIINSFADDDNINISLVLSNKSDCLAIKRAEAHGVPTSVVSKQDFADENILIPLLDKYEINFIVLAGFLLMIPDFLIVKYDHRIINIHPSLLPKHGGKGMYGHFVHEDVKNSGDTETGMTVHWVTNVCDGGDIIAQYRVQLSPEDTPEDIAEKEHQLEMKYFPQVIRSILE